VIAEKVTEVSKFLNKSVQTVAYCGFTKNEIKTAFKNYIFFGGDRFVPLGETLHFSFQWDGYDLLNAMSKTRYFS
jgi:hypothetical protein